MFIPFLQQLKMVLDSIMLYIHFLIHSSQQPCSVSTIYLHFTKDEIEQQSG